MGIYEIILGVVLIAAGRKFFWFFVGVTGFVLGMETAAILFPDAPWWGILALSIVTGAVGIWAAFFLQWAAVLASGFIGGGYVASMLLGLSGIGGEGIFSLYFLAGGIIGALLMFLIFDWALIVLSSLVGAAIAAGSLGLTDNLTAVLFVLLAASGIIIQSSFLKR
jgi:hypothetical protein